MKLLDFFTGVETWGEFWRLLDQLGADSRFAKAQEDDQELVDRMLQTSDGEEALPWRPAPSAWTLVHELLAQIRDRQGDIATLIADLPAARAKRTEPPPQFPRPQTALDRGRARVKVEQEQAYDDKIEDFVEQAKARWRAMSEAERDALGT